MYIDRYIDNAREVEQERALRALEEAEFLQGAEEYFRMMDSERDTEADITAMYQEHELERIGAR